MKPKFIFTAVGLLGFVIARAGIGVPGEGNGKREDLNGIVIHAESKKPLKDVSVTAYLSSKKEKVAISGEDGNYSFEELRPGTYKFVFEKAGFRKVVKDKVVVKTDETFQLNIEMPEAGGFDLMPSPLHLTDMN
jgi:hypothetical protein